MLVACNHVGHSSELIGNIQPAQKGAIHGTAVVFSECAATRLWYVVATGRVYSPVLRLMTSVDNHTQVVEHIKAWKCRDKDEFILQCCLCVSVTDDTLLS